MRLGKQKKKSMQNKTTTPFPYVSIYSSTSSSAFHFTNDGLRSLLILAWNRKRKKRIRRLKVLWSLLQGLPQNTQISTNILLILKENKLHKWDRCFLFVMTVTFLRPPSQKPPGCAIHKQGPYNMWPNTKDLDKCRYQDFGWRGAFPLRNLTIFPRCVEPSHKQTHTEAFLKFQDKLIKAPQRHSIHIVLWKVTREACACTVRSKQYF